jgi:hypothetical protein
MGKHRKERKQRPPYESQENVAWRRRENKGGEKGFPVETLQPSSAPEEHSPLVGLGCLGFTAGPACPGVLHPSTLRPIPLKVWHIWAYLK